MHRNTLTDADEYVKFTAGIEALGVPHSCLQLSITGDSEVDVIVVTVCDSFNSAAGLIFQDVTEQKEILGDCSIDDEVFGKWEVDSM